MPMPKPRSWPTLRHFAASPAMQARHLDCHPHGARTRIGEWQRIVEPDHEAVTGEALDGPFELVDERPEAGVVLAQDRHQVFRLGGLGKTGKAAQITKQNGDFPAVTVEQTLV